MYMRAALLALALGHVTAKNDPLDALRAVDDAQLLAEVARRGLAAAPPQRLLQEMQYSFKYECDCERDCPTSAEPTVLPTPRDPILRARAAGARAAVVVESFGAPKAASVST